MPGSLHRGAVMEQVIVTPTEAFCSHFFKCFFCHIGDRYMEDHFCETGRELIVAMLDEAEGRP